MLLNVLKMYNAEARFNKSLRPRKPEGSLGRTAQDVHLDSHTAPELCGSMMMMWGFMSSDVGSMQLLSLYIALYSPLSSRLTAILWHVILNE